MPFVEPTPYQPPANSPPSSLRPRPSALSSTSADGVKVHVAASVPEAVSEQSNVPAIVTVEPPTGVEIEKTRRPCESRASLLPVPTCWPQDVSRHIGKNDVPSEET